MSLKNQQSKETRHEPTGSALNLFILVGFLLLITAQVSGSGETSIFINGPSLSKHFGKYANLQNDFHWGLGVEINLKNGIWAYGACAHYMFNDSTGLNAYWIGMTGSLQFGNSKRFWLAPTLIVGGIKKAEYHHGQFAFFALPILGLGYSRIGLNIAYIPKIWDIPYHILMFQLKVRIH